MKRKLITILLVLAMVLTMLPMTALAATSEECAGGASCTHEAAIGATHYDTLKEAINAVGDNQTIVLLHDVAHAEGMSINTGKTFTVDFNEKTYTVSKPGAGSKNTETNAFQLIKGQNVTFKNGTIRLAEDNLVPDPIPNTSPIMYTNIRRIIQDYAELTLENMTIDSTNVYGNAMPMSFNNDPVKITGNTSIILKDGMPAAFDADGNWPSNNPYKRCKVTVDTTGTINGNIELGSGYLDIKNVNAKGIRFCRLCGADETNGQTGRLTITGGTFSSDVSAYLSDEYVQTEAGKVEPLSESNAVAKIETDGETAYFKTLTAAVAAAANGGTIDLLRNVSEQLWIRNNENVTLNLNGYTLSYKQQTANVRHGKLTVNGPGTIKENSPNFGPLMINGSTTPSDTDYSVITINNATLEGWAPVFVDQNSTKAYGVKVSLNGATLNSKPDVSGDLGAGIYVNGQITDATNAPVINLDSTNVISTGEGMYLAGYAITTVNGGSVIGGQTGIEIRSGKLTLNGGTYTSNASEYICVPNGNGSTTSGAALAIAQHTTKKNIDVTIFDGTFTGVKAISESNPQENDPAPQVTMPISGGKFNGDLTIADSHKFISGGHFTVDPSEYKADSMYVVPSTEAGYTYMVTDQAPTTVPVIVKDETAVTVEKAEGMTDQDVENIRTKTEVDGVAEAVNENAVVAASGIDTKATNVAKVEVSVSVNVEVKETNLNVEKDKSMTFSATPVATVTTTDASGAELNKKENVAVPNSYLDGKPITVKLPLPAGFNPVEITHICADGTHEVFTSEAGDGYKTFTIEEGCAVLTITKFSEFILKNTATVAAKIGNVSYRSLQDAINAAKDGETITLVGNSDENVTIAGKSLIIDKNNFALDGEITLGSYCTMTDADGKVTVRYNPPATPIEAGTPAQMPFQEVAKRFDDVPADAWFATGVYYAAENGLMNGTGNNLFSPYANTTRGMIMTILARRSGVNTAGSTPWYAAGMNWAKSAGVSDGTNPTAAVTREQLVAMLFRYAAFNGMDAVTLEENLGQFADRESVSGWAVSAMNWAVGQGLVEGSNGLLRPKATATRAEVATILMRFCALLKK